MKKLIFIGTSEFGLPALEKARESFELVSIVTQTDKPSGRKKISTPSPVKVWAESQNLSLLQPKKIIEAEQELAKLNPDLILVASYGQILPKKILLLPKCGCVNIHPSLLPKYRGPTPIQTALLNGDKETGVCLIQMDEKMDHGPIIATKTVPIFPDDDFSSLMKKLAEAGAGLVSENLLNFAESKIVPKEQDESKATFTKIFSLADARIDWIKPAHEIQNFIKALNPEPGAWTTLSDKSVKIIKGRALPSTTVELPGKAEKIGKDLAIKCTGGYLLADIVQPEGKKPMSGKDYLNGLKPISEKIFV
ncbi:MAG: methionyl-tRNA formyltransferase [Acidobacteriaceae bacterium]